MELPTGHVFMFDEIAILHDSVDILLKAYFVIIPLEENEVGIKKIEKKA